MRHNPKTDIERHIYNYDRRQYRTAQQQFEAKRVISVSKLGFRDIDHITEAVLDRLLHRTSSNHNHRPDLYDPDHKVAAIIHIDSYKHNDKA